MIRYSLKNYRHLYQRTLSHFSTRAEGDIEFHEFDGFTKVLLNRPKALNSLDLPMIKVLKRNIPAMEKAKAVWFEGAGGKSFCAGGDVKALFDQGAKISDRFDFFDE